MPLLVLIFLTAACMPEARAYSLYDWEVETRIIATASLALFGVLCASWLSFTTVRAAHGTPERRSAAISRYYATRWGLFFINMCASVIAIFVFGWGQVVEVFCRVPWHEGSLLAPFAELLVPATYLVNVVANWFIYYPAERALCRTSSNAQRQRFWSLPGFVLFNARQFALLILFPVTLSAGAFTLMRFTPVLLGEWWFQLGCLIAGGAAVLFILPWMIKPMFGLKSMPAGKYREQLETIEKRLKFRCTDLLLWPTRGGAANAMIVGILPQMRYVMFTDTLLESLTPAELDAVFGHEIGHAHHGHLAYYAVFILLSALALSGIVGFADVQAENSGIYATMPVEVRTWLKVVPLLFMGGYLFVVFGWLSRVCERQADIAGARAGSCGNMRCSGHEELADRASDGDAENPSLARPANKIGPLCETGIRAMVMALEAVMGMNGLGGSESKRGFAKRWLAWFRSWQHGPPNARIEFLQSLMDKPGLALVHERYAFRLRVGVAVVLIAIIAATGTAIGWHELWRMM